MAENRKAKEVDCCFDGHYYEGRAVDKHGNLHTYRVSASEPNAAEKASRKALEKAQAHD